MPAISFLFSPSILPRTSFPLSLCLPFFAKNWCPAASASFPIRLFLRRRRKENVVAILRLVVSFFLAGQSCIRPLAGLRTPLLGKRTCLGWRSQSHFSSFSCIVTGRLAAVHAEWPILCAGWRLPHAPYRYESRTCRRLCPRYLSISFSLNKT